MNIIIIVQQLDINQFSGWKESQYIDALKDLKAVMAEKTSAAAVSLTNKAGEMSELMDFFKVSTSTSS